MFGQRLKLARKKAGLSMRELSQQVSPRVSVQAISKYENDKMLPTSAVLVGLSKVLNVSLDFLLGGQVAELQGVEFRKHSGVSAKDVAKAEAIVTEALEAYLAIEDILEIHAEVDMFEGVRVDHINDIADVDAIALKLREAWNLGNDPIPSMTSLLEDKGIKVIEVDLPDRFDGMACTVVRSEGRPDTEVVVVAKKSGIERKRFNLAHELGHRVIVATGNSEIKIEKAVNRFAAAFLIPAEHLRAEAGESRTGITFHEIVQLKHTYGVSASAMLMRLRDAGILSDGYVTYAFQSYARQWRRSEPKPIGSHEGFGSFEKPQRFERLVWHALGEDMISPVRAADLLGEPLRFVEEQIRGPHNS